MDIVLILRNGTLSLTRLISKGEMITVDSHAQYDCPALEKALESAESTKEFLETYLNVEEIKNNKFYIVFAPGSGIAYKTWQTALASLSDATDKNAKEREDRVLALCQENLPNGLTELYSNYTGSIVSCYEDDVSTVSSCYIPTLYLNNLKLACEALGITLFKVSDVTSCLKTIVDSSKGQLFVHSDGLISVINEFGTMSWLTPANCTDEMLKYFASLTERYFPLQEALKHSQLVEIDKIRDYLTVHISSNEMANTEDIVVSSGCIATVKHTKELGLTKNGKGGGLDNVIGKLRKLFEEK